MAADLNDRNSLYNFVVANGLKALVDAGLTEIPELYVVKPSQKRLDKLYSTTYDRPPMDLSKLDGPDHDQVVEELARAAETVGVFQVVNHGMPSQLLESVVKASHDFHGLPPERKASYREGVSSNHMVGFGTSIYPDKEEVLQWKDHLRLNYTTDAEALDYWPREVKNAALEYLTKSCELAEKLLRMLVGKLGVTLDDSKVSALIDSKKMFLHYYPQCPRPEITSGARSHSDFGILTILLQDDVGGLHVKVEDDTGGEKEVLWMKMPHVPGALIIFVGDSLQILSNGRYRSAEHEVRTTCSRSRVSIPVFTAPKLTEMIGPFRELMEMDGMARYGDTVYGEYMKYGISKVFEETRPLDSVRIKSP